MRRATLLFAVALTLVSLGQAAAAELKIFGSRVTKIVVEELASDFELATGLKPVVSPTWRRR